jgi:hypothetical protein
MMEQQNERMASYQQAQSQRDMTSQLRYDMQQNAAVQQRQDQDYQQGQQKYNAEQAQQMSHMRKNQLRNRQLTRELLQAQRLAQTASRPRVQAEIATDAPQSQAQQQLQQPRNVSDGPLSVSEAFSKQALDEGWIKAREMLNSLSEQERNQLRADILLRADQESRQIYEKHGDVDPVFIHYYNLELQNYSSRGDVGR